MNKFFLASTIHDQNVTMKPTRIRQSAGLRLPLEFRSGPKPQRDDQLRNPAQAKQARCAKQHTTPLPALPLLHTMAAERVQMTSKIPAGSDQRRSPARGPTPLLLPYAYEQQHLSPGDTAPRCAVCGTLHPVASSFQRDQKSFAKESTPKKPNSRPGPTGQLSPPQSILERTSSPRRRVYPIRDTQARYRYDALFSLWLYRLYPYHRGPVATYSRLDMHCFCRLLKLQLRFRQNH